MEFKNDEVSNVFEIIGRDKLDKKLIYG